MRRLDTAIDKGEERVPGERHKVTRYALAPGDAYVIEPEEKRGAVQIDSAMARRAEYRYLLSWLEGRTVAEFDLDKMVVVQPINPDPVERRKRGENPVAGGLTEACGSIEGPGVAAGATDRRRLPVPEAPEAPRCRGEVPALPRKARGLDLGDAPQARPRRRSRAGSLTL